MAAGAARRGIWDLLALAPSVMEQSRATHASVYVRPHMYNGMTPWRRGRRASDTWTPQRFLEGALPGQRAAAMPGTSLAENFLLQNSLAAPQVLGFVVLICGSALYNELLRSCLPAAGTEAELRRRRHHRGGRRKRHGAGGDEEEGEAGDGAAEPLLPGEAGAESSAGPSAAAPPAAPAPPPPAHSQGIPALAPSRAHRVAPPRGGGGRFPGSSPGSESDQFVFARSMRLGPGALFPSSLGGSVPAFLEEGDDGGSPSATSAEGGYSYGPSSYGGGMLGGYASASGFESGEETPPTPSSGFLVGPQRGGGAGSVAGARGGGGSGAPRGGGAPIPQGGARAAGGSGGAPLQIRRSGGGVPPVAAPVPGRGALAAAMRRGGGGSGGNLAERAGAQQEGSSGGGGRPPAGRSSLAPRPPPGSAEGSVEQAPPQQEQQQQQQQQQPSGQQ
jgi:hypothetical protein